MTNFDHMTMFSSTQVDKNMCFKFSLDFKSKKECAESDKARLYCGFCYLSRRKGIFILGAITLGVYSFIFVACAVVAGFQKQIYDNINHELDNIKRNYMPINDYDFQTTETLLVSYEKIIHFN